MQVVISSKLEEGFLPRFLPLHLTFSIFSLKFCCTHDYVYLSTFEFVCRSAPSFSFYLVFLGVAGAPVCDLPQLTRSKATLRQAAVISYLSPLHSLFTIALGLDDEKAEVCLKHVRMTRVCWKHVRMRLVCA